jgi:hypothetical protein
MLNVLHLILLKSWLLARVQLCFKLLNTYSPIASPLLFHPTISDLSRKLVVVVIDKLDKTNFVITKNLSKILIL